MKPGSGALLRGHVFSMFDPSRRDLSLCSICMGVWLCHAIKQHHIHAGLVFVGGFSYADVLGSAKGWAGTIRHNPQLWQAFNAFYSRYSTVFCCCTAALHRHWATCQKVALGCSTFSIHHVSLHAWPMLLRALCGILEECLSRCRTQSGLVSHLAATLCTHASVPAWTLHLLGPVSIHCDAGWLSMSARVL